MVPIQPQDITVNITNVNDNNPVITSANEYKEKYYWGWSATAMMLMEMGPFSITSDSNMI